MGLASSQGTITAQGKEYVTAGGEKLRDDSSIALSVLTAAVQSFYHTVAAELLKPSLLNIIINK